MERGHAVKKIIKIGEFFNIRLTHQGYLIDVPVSVSGGNIHTVKTDTLITEFLQHNIAAQTDIQQPAVCRCLDELPNGSIVFVFFLAPVQSVFQLVGVSKKHKVHLLSIHSLTAAMSLSICSSVPMVIRSHLSITGFLK